MHPSVEDTENVIKWVKYQQLEYKIHNDMLYLYLIPSRARVSIFVMETASNLLICSRYLDANLEFTREMDIAELGVLLMPTVCHGQGLFY